MEGARYRKQGHSAIPVVLERRDLDRGEKKASRSWLKTILLGVPALLLLALLGLCLVPSPIQTQQTEPLPEPPAAVGPLAPNAVLTHAEKLYVNEVHGPESFASDGDTLYTGCADGWVKAIRGGKVKNLVHFGKEPCGGHQNENTCGRPLGMRLAKDGSLLVLDAYLGLFKVNVNTGDYITLYSSKTPVNGRPSKLLNDLDIGPDGKIYFTDSSTKWHRNQFLNIILEGEGNGRLLQYNPSTDKVTQLMDGLVFANGVQLNKDKTAIFVVETTKARVHKFDLKTQKYTVWADNLPGFPDNIRYSPSTGNYWVGMAIPRIRGRFSLLEFILDKPWLRTFLAKVVSMNMYLSLVAKMDAPAMVVELNEQGDVVGSLQSPDGRMLQAVSEVGDIDGLLYLGSFHAPYVGRLDRRNGPALGKE